MNITLIIIIEILIKHYKVFKMSSFSLVRVQIKNSEGDSEFINSNPIDGPIAVDDFKTVYEDVMKLQSQGIGIVKISFYVIFEDEDHDTIIFRPVNNWTSIKNNDIHIEKVKNVYSFVDQ